MRPQVVTQTGVGQSDPIVVNYRQNNFKIGLATDVVAPATYTIQHTLDDPANFSSASDYNTNANWFDNDIADLVGATTNQDGNIFFPIRAIRVNQTVGAGSVELTVLQGNAT